MEKCIGCKFFYPIIPTSEDGKESPPQTMGVCRRSPPQLAPTPTGPCSSFPVMQNLGWCGEFAAAEVTQETH